MLSGLNIAAILSFPLGGNPETTANWIPNQERNDGFFVFFSISIPRPESLRDCGVVY
jgi:hypothetical protein